jgi:adenine/guanine/hypoxanthine permease
MNSSILKISSREINAFFGLFLNNLTNLLVLVGLLITIQIPDAIIFKHILPGITFAILVSSILYSFMAYNLSVKENRDDVTALPSGLSVPHMFLIVFAVMLPVYQSTGDAKVAWYAAIGWSILEGVVEIIGSIIGPWLRRQIPRAALLGSLAGVSLIFIALRPFVVSMEYPYISFISFIFIFLGWMNKRGYFTKLPLGLIIILVGILSGLVSKQIDFGGVASSFSISINLPIPMFSQIIEVINTAWPYLLTAIPLGIYNFIESMDNLESASVAGDDYSTRHAMLYDGTTTIIGCLFGSAFPTSIYIGHPGWKQIGGRITYSVLSSFAVFLIVVFGLVGTLVHLIPSVAILPILVFIGISITTQAFEEVPKSHIPAVIFAILPWMASWCKNLIDSSLLSASSSISEPNIYASLLKNDINYHGYETLSQGTILISMLWASIVVFVIQDKLNKAAITTCVAAILSFVGFIHANDVMINASPSYTIGYLLMTVILLLTFYFYKNKLTSDEPLK